MNALRALRNLLSVLLPAPEFVVLQISGTLPERRPAPPGMLRRRFLPFAPPPPESLEEWRERLRLLASEPRVKGIIIKVGDLHAGLTSLESLRHALQHFRESGKGLAAYLPTTDLYAYYLASVADPIVVPESGELFLHGPRLEATFLRIALDRLGIIPQFHHIAEYKSAANRFLYPEMPEAQREMTTSLLDSVFGEVTAAIARARGLSVDAVRQGIDQGILSAAEAKDRKLIDAVAFEDDLPRLLAHRPGSPRSGPGPALRRGSGQGGGDRLARILPWAQARRHIRIPYRWQSLRRQAIGVVQLVGTIVPGESRELPFPLPLFGPHIAGHETIGRAFRLAEKLPAIKAIVFHVDSGGGSAVASDLIWREVTRVQRNKPVVVYMGNVAGSGGYYVGCGARHIVAGATTVTGSIGVVAGKFNAQGLYAKGGLRREVIAQGETATMFSGFTSFTEQEWNTLRRWMEEIYLRFKERVAAGRGRPVGEIETVARGRVWTGRQAVERGLVDEIGDFEAAVRKAKALAGIPVDADVPLVTVRPPKVSGVPAAPAAAWSEAWRAVATLLNEQTWLLLPPEFLLPQ